MTQVALTICSHLPAEKWWIDSLARHPILVPYTLGRRRLDKLYLDTTFARASNPLREFPSKAEGLAELLRKVGAYPEDTLFYFRAWTFGYEDVWLALSAALNTKVRRASVAHESLLANARIGPCGSISDGTLPVSHQCYWQ